MTPRLGRVGRLGGGGAVAPGWLSSVLCLHGPPLEGSIGHGAFIFMLFFLNDLFLFLCFEMLKNTCMT